MAPNSSWLSTAATATSNFVFKNRALGPFAGAYWTMVSCNVLIPQLLWFRKLRSTLPVVFVIVVLVNVGMWFERFVIIVTSLHRDFLPSSWASYAPTTIEIATFIGSFGLFFTCFLDLLPHCAGHRHCGDQGRRSFEEASAGRVRCRGESSMSDRVLLATFEHEDDLLAATDAVRRDGFQIVDAFTPYAVHGLDRALGLRPSRLTWVCFVCGMAGALGMLWFEHWTASIELAA